MKSVRSLLLATAMIAASASMASAATVNAVVVEQYQNYGGVSDPARTNTNNALGAPDGTFLSLGLGGWAVFTFGSPFGSPVGVIEVTNGNRNSHQESAEVWAGIGTYSGLGGTAGLTLLGVIFNTVNNGVAQISGFTEVFDFLFIKDTSPVVRDRDGYDIDSISVAAVPLPAGVALLGSGVAALGFMGWRRKQQPKAV